MGKWYLSHLSRFSLPRPCLTVAQVDAYARQAAQRAEAERQSRLAAAMQDDAWLACGRQACGRQGGRVRDPEWTGRCGATAQGNCRIETGIYGAFGEIYVAEGAHCATPEKIHEDQALLSKTSTKPNPNTKPRPLKSTYSPPLSLTPPLCQLHFSGTYFFPLALATVM